MSDQNAARPAVPRFDLRLQRGEARLLTRGALPLRLGSVDALELVAGELERSIDLRHGALLFRDRRTHALRASFSLDVPRLERALEAVGVPLRLHRSALPAPSRDDGATEAAERSTCGVTLSTREGPIDCLAEASLVADRLHVRLSHFATLLPCEERAHAARDALRPLERALRFASCELRLHGEGEWLEVVVNDVVAALLAEPFAHAGWRLPRTRGLFGRVRWRDVDERGRAAIVFSVGVDPQALVGTARLATNGEPDPGGPDADVPYDTARDEARETLGQAVADARRAAVPEVDLVAHLDHYVAHEPSGVMCAHALLTVAETILVTGVPGPSAALVSDLALRALSHEPDSPRTARRVLAVAQRLPRAADERLLSAVLAAPLPAAQQAALVLEAFPSVLDASTQRARTWLSRVRPFVTDTASLRVAEAALQAAEAERAAAPAPPGQAEERAAEALAEARRFAEAAAAFARAARAYQHGRQALAAARCWVACVSSVHPDSLLLEWIVPGAFALHLSGRTQDAIALLATLLSREAGPQGRELLDHALESAVRFHEALPSPMGSPELFAARRRELSPAS